MRQSTGDYQLAEEIIIDGLEEHAFRRSIEVMLRNGRADEAVERLRKLLPEVAGEGKTLPARLIELSPEDIRLAGWDQLSTKVEEYSRPTIPITAIGIGIGDPSDNGLVPDAAGNLRPPLETSYYSDATFPFSETVRVRMARHRPDSCRCHRCMLSRRDGLASGAPCRDRTGPAPPYGDPASQFRCLSILRRTRDDLRRVSR
jgi:hypothetical protein